MIQLKGLGKSYDGGKNWAIRDLELEVPSGTVCAFLGANGAGKSTTLKIITGILQPGEGSASVGGQDIQTRPLEAKRLFGWVPDAPEIFPRLRALELARFAASAHGLVHKAAEAEARSLGNALGLDKEWGQPLGNLSHGTRQKILMIVSLLHDPPVWILDEPMTGLDPASVRVVKDWMAQRSQRGLTVFFSTHLLDTAEKVCDTLAIIHKGKILYHGSMEHFRSSNLEASLEEAFLKVTGGDGA